MLRRRWCLAATFFAVVLAIVVACSFGLSALGIWFIWRHWQHTLNAYKQADAVVSEQRTIVIVGFSMVNALFFLMLVCKIWLLFFFLFFFWLGEAVNSASRATKLDFVHWHKLPFQMLYCVVQHRQLCKEKQLGAQILYFSTSESLRTCSIMPSQRTFSMVVFFLFHVVYFSKPH